MNKIQLLDNKPTCFDCQNSHIIEGQVGDYYNPPIADDVECNLDDEKFEEAGVWIAHSTAEKLSGDFIVFEEYAPLICKFFAPKKLHFCGNCNKEMNVPQYNWPLFGFIGPSDPIPVCSQECKDEIKKKDKELQDEENRQREEFLKDMGRLWDET